MDLKCTYGIRKTFAKCLTLVLLLGLVDYVVVVPHETKRDLASTNEVCPSLFKRAAERDELRPSFLSSFFSSNTLYSNKVNRKYYESAGVKVTDADGENAHSRFEISPHGDTPLNRFSRYLGDAGTLLMYDDQRLSEASARGAFDSSAGNLYLTPRKANDQRPLYPTDFHEVLHFKVNRIAEQNPSGHSFAGQLKNRGRKSPQLDRVGYGEFMGIDEIPAHIREMRIILGRMKEELKRDPSKGGKKLLREDATLLSEICFRPLIMAKALGEVLREADRDLREGNYTYIPYHGQTSALFLNGQLQLNIGQVVLSRKDANEVMDKRVHRQHLSLLALTQRVKIAKALFEKMATVSAGSSYEQIEKLHKGLKELDNDVMKLLNWEVVEK